MERKLNKRIDEYICNFKNIIVEKIKEISNEEEKNNVINFIYNFEKMTFNKEDFQKRKRTKNLVPNYERCCAKRANGQQCTRRKKEECNFCGTHSKGTPHGVYDENEPIPTEYKLEVSAIDIKGIVYYIDNNSNVYDTSDILANKKNPRVIANYERNGDEYVIPELQY